MSREACQPDDPARMCTERREAMKRGEFFFDSTPPYMGWKFVSEPSSEYRPPPRFPLHFCLYCGGSLPDAATILRNLYRESGDGPE